MGNNKLISLNNIELVLYNRGNLFKSSKQKHRKEENAQENICYYIKLSMQ